MMVAHFEKIPYVPGSQKLVIENLGQTVARDVLVTFDPEIPDTDPADRKVCRFIKERFAKPIPVIAPRLLLEDVWFLGVPGPDGKYVNAEPTASSVTVRMSYYGPDGTHYDEDFPIDIDLLQFTTTTTASDSPEQIAKNALTELKKITNAISTISKHATK